MGGLAQNDAVDVVANADAVHWHVPASAVSVVLDQHVQNGLAAVEQIKVPKVAVKAVIRRPTVPFQSPILLLQDTDNGVGMPLKLSKRPQCHSSQQRRARTGLGSTSCVQMATSLGDKLTIVRKPGIGRTIRVRIPLPRAVRFSPS